MNFKLRSKIYVISALVLLAYFYFYGFGALKTLVGYNVPEFKNPPISNGIDFLSVDGDFAISVFVDKLDGPRVIAFDPSGKMLVSETKAGRVSLIKDTDGDGFSEIKNVIISGLDRPHGLTFFVDNGTTYLYIAEADKVVRYAYNVKDSSIINIDDGEVIANYPSGGRHFTRTIDFGPNFRTTPIISGIRSENTLSKNKLYISVGSSCDVCLEQSWKRGAILESDPRGSFTAEFAGGLRNSVFFTFHPVTGAMWATEMGRDNLGDNIPPDEINIIKVADKDIHKFGARRYGWPFCYGDQIRDKKFNPGDYDRIDIPEDCSQTESSTIDIQAHSAPLGLAFISNNAWPQEWQNNLLVAYHGSWNRSKPVGYKIVRFNVDEDGKLFEAEQDFITGWLNRNDIFGRPVDLKFGPNNNLYISDDAGGIIYKVSPK
jgi:glucose/arabinose dehydrogenase